MKQSKKVRKNFMEAGLYNKIRKKPLYIPKLPEEFVLEQCVKMLPTYKTKKT